jgi:hypothetical protein
MKTVRRESLGRPAVILVPSVKLESRFKRARRTIREEFEDFLLKTYGGFTCAVGMTHGRWRDPRTGEVFYGEHRVYTVAFLGKHRIPQLERRLAKLATYLGERCIYLETGEDAWLIYAGK